MATINQNDDGTTQLKSTLPQLDQIRLDSLNDAINTATIRNAAMTSEITRLTKKYGSNDQRVKIMTARVAQYPAVVQVMNTEVTRSSSTLPVVTKDKWLVQGHVYDTGMIPVQGVTVFFVNSDGAGISSLGFACTDKGGFYYVQGNTDVLTQLGDQSIFLSISDTTKKVLYKGTSPITLIVGSVNYQSVFLMKEGCQSPPFAG